MLRLPPPLRRLVASAIFRVHTQASTQQLFPHASASRESCWSHHDAWSSHRGYSTAPPLEKIPKSSNNGEEIPLSTSNLRQALNHGEPQENVAALYAKLETGGGPIDDQTYDETERDLLLESLSKATDRKPTYRTKRRLQTRIRSALEQGDALNALRRLAVVQDGIPMHLRAKISVRLKDALTIKPSKEGPEESPKAVPLRLFDVEHIKSVCALPSKEQYSTALQELWDPTFVSSAVHNRCNQLKLSLESEVSYTHHDLSAEQLKARPAGATYGSYQRCNLSISIENLCHETGFGEGLGKNDARRAAWMHVLSKLHVSDALAELFPTHETDEQEPAQMIPTDTVRVGSVVEQHPVEDEVEDEDEKPFELAEVDKQTLEEEKDGKIEIYNYAASLGLVPKFEVKTVQLQTSQAKLGRRPKTPAPAVQVFIRIEELSIDVSAIGANLRIAEVAAGLAFKQKAQDRLVEGDSLREEKYSVLTMDSAKEFLDFCKEHSLPMALAMEIEPHEGDITMHEATLTADGRPLGQKVILRSRNDAKAAAYLTGALEVAKQHPHLLEEFRQAPKNFKGQLLKAAKTIDVELDPEASQIMRAALVEAHTAGLPVVQEALVAERNDADPGRVRRHQSLDALSATRAVRRLFHHQIFLDCRPKMQKLREKKALLPMSHYKHKLVSMINGNQYSVVVGATGSGKTTQVPQILFEDAIRQREGATCNIICTQPRRLAATSVAQRVAEERDEPLRKTVGYHVRFDARYPYNPYGITYCTTGILLERLKHDPEGTLDAASHILIDEVHERDINIDFLMIVLKTALQARCAAGKKVPKVVLMSATLDTELFANYFEQPDQHGNLRPAPCLSVPGRTFPVKEKYLGSIIDELLGEHGDEAKQLIAADSDSEDFVKAETEFSSATSTQAQSTDSKPDSMIDWKRERTPSPDTEGLTSVKNEKEEALVPVGLVAATIAHICATASGDGAILTFFPGLDDITSTQDLLQQRQIFGLNFADTSKFKICLLHSTLPKEQQSEVFESLPKGCRKIILSTNIAETSVTVADVKYVVDTGKLKENRYDQLRRITKLQCVWESKSNSKQRMGRAGRVQDGFYYALFSKERADSLRAVGLPELLRSDLQEICLDITSQRFNHPVASFLAQAIEPPSERAVHAAVTDLTSIGAYTADEELTALGRVLSKLPVHPTLGKMIILGIIFKCLDPMIALGAAAEERSLFVSPLGRLQEANAAHATYAGENQSDHLAFLAAFQELRQLKHDAGLSAVRDRSKEQLLHFGAFRTIDQSAHQIVEVLTAAGLIPKHAVSHAPAYGPVDLNLNTNNSDMIKCLVLAGFHPNLAVKSSTKGALLRTPTESTTMIHPSSLNKERKSGPSTQVHPANTLFAFSTLASSAEGATLFLRSTTKVTPLMALLFGGMVHMPEPGQLTIDDWMPFSIEGMERDFGAKLLLEFRKALERVLQRAYASLAHLDGGDRHDGGEGGDGWERSGITGFAHDPVRERFAERVVQVLKAKGLEQWRSGKGDELQ